MSVRLSPKQQEVVERADGAALVLAAAGSGKTRVLTERIRSILAIKKGHFKILALTFTNKAATEMKERLADIPDLADKAFIGTIHAFCQMLLEAHGQTIGLARTPVILEREVDRLAVLEEVILNNAVLRQFYHNKPSERERRKWLYDLLAAISAQKRQLTGFPDSNSEFSSEEEELVYRLYCERLSSQGSIDFDDILLLAYRILTEQAHVAQLYSRIYRYICVDEAQDLNFAQYALIRILAAANGNILLVGSPNQAIYGFNGSDAHFMLEEFPQDFTVARYELKENYRSSKAVIRAANMLFPHNVMADPACAPIQGECRLESLPNEELEAAWVVAKIKVLLAAEKHSDIETPITAKSMAILARNRYVFSAVEKKLKEEKVPYYYKRSSTESVLESDFVQCFDLGLRIIVNPLDRLHWGQLCHLLGCNRVVEKGTNGIEQLTALSSLLGDEWKQKYSALLAAWSSVANDANSFGRCIEQLQKFFKDGATTKTVTTDDTEKALVVADFNFLNENWRNYLYSTQAEMRTLGHFRNQISMGLTTPLDERDGIALATVHSVKGLEYEIVFLIGMTEGTFPDYRAVKLGGKALEEEKNEAYVAITRARRLLYITYPQTRVMPWDKANNTCTKQEPSRFLDGMTDYELNHTENAGVRMVADGISMKAPQ